MTFEPIDDDEYEIAAARPPQPRPRGFWRRLWWTLAGHGEVADDTARAELETIAERMRQRYADRLKAKGEQP